MQNCKLNIAKNHIYYAKLHFYFMNCMFFWGDVLLFKFWIVSFEDFKKEGGLISYFVEKFYKPHPLSLFFNRPFGDWEIKIQRDFLVDVRI